MRTGMLLITILIVFSILVYVFYDDVETEPKIVNNVTVCPPNEKIQPSKDNSSRLICFNEAPLGHVYVTFPQMALQLSIILLLGLFTLQGKREFRSSKIFFAEDKTQDEYVPVTKYSDIKHIKGFYGVRGGYDHILPEKNNNFYILRDDITSTVGKNVLVFGRKTQINIQFLYQYLGRDLNLLRLMLDDNNINIENKKITISNSKAKIFIATPLPYAKLRDFLSLKGRYSPEADRYDIIITFLMKMKRNLRHSKTIITDANQQMLDTSQDVALATANTAEEYGRTRAADIVKGTIARKQEELQKNEEVMP